jgi:hypothetical protein
MVATFGSNVPGGTPMYSHFPPTQYFFAKANVSALWRVCKSDNNCIMGMVGAMIINCVSKSAPLNASFRYITFLTECTTPKVCTILLYGPSKDILNELDHNLTDVMSVMCFACSFLYFSLFCGQFVLGNTCWQRTSDLFVVKLWWSFHDKENLFVVMVCPECVYLQPLVLTCPIVGFPP